MLQPTDKAPATNIHVLRTPILKINMIDTERDKVAVGMWLHSVRLALRQLWFTEVQYRSLEENEYITYVYLALLFL